MKRGKRATPPASCAHPPLRARKTLLYNADDIARQLHS